MDSKSTFFAPNELYGVPGVEDPQKAPKPKAVVVLSGGLDSTTLLYETIHQGYEPVALSIDYGQRHRKELTAAAMICQGLGVRHYHVHLGNVGLLLSGSALTDDSVEVPEGHYAAPNMASTVVPNRNAILLSIAWGLAVAQGAEVVAYGAHAGDHPVYPDCRPEFSKALEEALYLGNEGYQNQKLRLWTPFIRMSKGNIVTLGAKLRVPFEETWSCYKGGANHCGLCGTCVERREAFEIAGIMDPTVYDNPPHA